MVRYDTNKWQYIHKLIRNTLYITVISISVYLWAPVLYQGSQPFILKIASSQLDTVDETLDFLDVNDYYISMSRYNAWHRLLVLGGSPNGREALDIESRGNDTRAIYSNMALFRLRDHPETRLRAIVSIALQGWPRNSMPVISRFINDDLDPVQDRSYVYIFQEGIKALEDPNVQLRLNSSDVRASVPINGYSIGVIRNIFDSAINRLK